MEDKLFLWDECYGEVSLDRIMFVERELNIKLPDSYLRLVQNCDGGYPTNNAFKYLDAYSKKVHGSGIGSFLSLNPREHYYDEILGTHNSPAEFFPKGLIAFADTGNGDYICFDYRLAKKETDPPIVYWSHEGTVGEDVSFIASNFEKFLVMLEKPIDIDLI